jgi:hypothetical protein
MLQHHVSISVPPHPVLSLAVTQAGTTWLMWHSPHPGRPVGVSKTWEESTEPTQPCVILPVLGKAIS